MNDWNVAEIALILASAVHALQDGDRRLVDADTSYKLAQVLDAHGVVAKKERRAKDAADDFAPFMKHSGRTSRNLISRLTRTDPPRPA